MSDVRRVFTTMEESILKKLFDGEFNPQEEIDKLNTPEYIQLIKNLVAFYTGWRETLLKSSWNICIN